MSIKVGIRIIGKYMYIYSVQSLDIHKYVIVYSLIQISLNGVLA